MIQTVAEFKTEMMQEFGLNEDNDNEGTGDDAIVSYINDANAQFINHRAWTWRRKAKTSFIYPDTTVKTEFTVSGPTIELNQTDNWGSAGRVMIDTNIIEFTANNTSTDILTPALTDIDRVHEVGERALLLYEVPSDFNKISSMQVQDTRYYPEDNRDAKEPSPGKFWVIKVLKTDGSFKEYFVFPYHTTRQKIYYKYGVKATDYKTIDDLSTAYIEVPFPYRNFMKHKVSARIYRHLEELNTAETHEKEAMKILINASVYDSKQHYGNRIPIRTAWDNPAVRMGISGLRSGSFNRD